MPRLWLAVITHFAFSQTAITTENLSNGKFTQLRTEVIFAEGKAIQASRHFDYQGTNWYKFCKKSPKIMD